MYVDVTEVCDDWGVSRAQGYKIIKQLNDRMLAINPNLIVLSGKATGNDSGDIRNHLRCGVFSKRADNN